mgnify:CR=1 FL=1|jgi:hypothetical protein
MKAILINTQKINLEQVEVADFRDMQKAIGCNNFTVAHRFKYEGKPYTIFVDDEGLYKYRELFYYEGSHQPFFGNGLILQDLPGGESGDADIPLDFIESKITYGYYMTPEEQEVYNERWGIL